MNGSDWGPSFLGSAPWFPFFQEGGGGGVRWGIGVSAKKQFDDIQGYVASH